MKYKPKKKFKQSSGRLAPNHTWKAPAGYKIFVMDRGAASFNIPENWVLHKFEPVEILDAEPPDDNARLSVTLWRFASGVDWSGLPLEPLLVQATSGSEQKLLAKSAVFQPKRDDLELAWTEHRFLDPVEPREAFSRIAIARFSGIHLLITFDYWVDDQAKMTPVWDEVLRSLQMGRVIADPLKGETLH